MEARETAILATLGVPDPYAFLAEARPSRGSRAVRRPAIGR
jgi:hypothetical protein